MYFETINLFLTHRRWNSKALKVKLTTEKQQKECFFAALVGFPTTKTVKNIQNWAKQPQNNPKRDTS